MLAGQQGGAISFWAALRPRHRNSGLREDSSGRVARRALGSEQKDGHPHADQNQPDHAGGRDGLHRQRIGGGGAPHRQRAGSWRLASPLLSVALLLCIGDNALSAADQFRRTTLLFQHGQVAASQETAAQLADRYQASNPIWSARFRLLEAQSMVWRGMSQDVLRILATAPAVSADPDVRTFRLSLLAAANIHLHRYGNATQYLAEADQLCASVDRAVCSSVLHTHWTLADEQARYNEAYQFSTQELAVARKFAEPFDEALALNNLAATFLQQERYDEAID